MIKKKNSTELKKHKLKYISTLKILTVKLFLRFHRPKKLTTGGIPSECSFYIIKG